MATLHRHYNYSNNVVHIFLDSSKTLSEQMHKLDIKMDDENQNIGNMKGLCMDNYTSCREVVFFTDINIE